MAHATGTLRNVPCVDAQAADSTRRQRLALLRSQPLCCADAANGNLSNFFETARAAGSADRAIGGRTTYRARVVCTNATQKFWFSAPIGSSQRFEAMSPSTPAVSERAKSRKAGLSPGEETSRALGSPPLPQSQSPESHRSGPNNSHRGQESNRRPMKYFPMVGETTIEHLERNRKAYQEKPSPFQHPTGRLVLSVLQ